MNDKRMKEQNVKNGEKDSSRSVIYRIEQLQMIYEVNPQHQ